MPCFLTLQHKGMSPGEETMKRTMRSTTLLIVALLAAVGLVASACSSDETAEAGTVSGPQIVLGAQDFGESAILAEIYSQALAEAGYDTRIQTLGGFRDISMGAFSGGDINFAPEYVASLLEFLNGNAGVASGDLTTTLAELQSELGALGLEALEPAPGVDTNAFVVTAETSERLGLTKLSDLANLDAPIKLGGPADCETNPFCIPGLSSAYGADLSASFVGLDSGVVATALGNGEIDIAVLFSTDGRIAAEGWVLLEDDQSMLAADNIVPVVTAELIDAYGEAMAQVVNAVSEKLTTPVLIQLNRQFDVDKQSARDIAAAWLADNSIS
jgi:osmoprotectant transport system substrate-binding protein